MTATIHRVDTLLALFPGSPTLVPSWGEPGNKAATLLQSFKASKSKELCSQTALLKHCINIKIYHGMDTVVV